MLLEVRGLSKRFPGVIALEDVDLDGRAGEVHALVGANGAGKSTLMNLLSGVFPPTAGEIRLDGKSVSFATPRQAAERGISTVYQEFSSIPQLSVADNIVLGREPTRRLGLLDRKAQLTEVRSTLERYNLNLDPDAPVEELSVAQQQLVEIAHALAVEARVLILDEPTAVLSMREQDNLFQIVRGLKAAGMLVLYVSHRMEEIFSISDRVSVLRDGRKIATVATDSTSQAEIVQMMIGRDVVQGERLSMPAERVPVLRARLGNDHNDDRSELIVHAGEILGLAGLVGAGRTRLARSIIGQERRDSLGLELDGSPVSVASPADALAKGIVYLSEDRKREGLFANLSILWNASATSLARYSRGGFVSTARERQDGGAILERLRLVASSLDAPVSQLSGGNQQKVLFGRALLCQPRVLICDEPTRGVDIGAKAEIYRLLAELAAQGVAVVFISSELKELLANTHRIMVMRDRMIAGEYDTAQVDEETVLLAATGAAQTGS